MDFLTQNRPWGCSCMFHYISCWRGKWDRGKSVHYQGIINKALRRHRRVLYMRHAWWACVSEVRRLLYLSSHWSVRALNHDLRPRSSIVCCSLNHRNIGLHLLRQIKLWKLLRANHYDCRRRKLRLMFEGVQLQFRDLDCAPLITHEWLVGGLE